MTTPPTPRLAGDHDTRSGGVTTLPAVLGLDLSITSTGVATINGTTFTIRTRAVGDLRLVEIHEALADHLATADLVVIEDLPTHANGAGITGMVQGVVRLACFDHLARYALVPPATLKKYATGKGNATKPDMRMELFRRSGIDERDDNRVDAYWLRAMGLDHLGHPPIDLPKINRAALDKVAWPYTPELETPE